MSIIEQATRRLEELARAGVSVPWDAAGLSQTDVQARVEAAPVGSATKTSPAAGLHPQEEVIGSTTGASVRHLRMPEKVEAKKSVVLDLVELERTGHLIPTQTKSILAEEFRQIKRPLVRNARSKEAEIGRQRLIMITSALPGEGKTFCALNLAMSMAAEIDMSVLLVDADVVRPQIMQRLGLQASNGLLDLLKEDAKLSEVLLETSVPKLSILPSGARDNLSTELLASESMERLLLQLSNENPNRVVIFDAPPLLVTNEAKVLAARVGQVVLVVEASSTPRSALAQALAAVDQCPNLMTILNKARRSEVPTGYSYYD